MSNSIIAFQTNTAPDRRGRYLAEIQQWPDDLLERTHDYIQWMFPLSAPSAFNPSTPVLDLETIQEFRSRSDLQEGLRASFRRMLDFYGFVLVDVPKLMVQSASNFQDKAANWLTPNNHNHLRITRILRCLRLLGLEAEAAAFFCCLTEIYRADSKGEDPRITAETFSFWQQAVSQ